MLYSSRAGISIKQRDWFRENQLSLSSSSRNDHKKSLGMQYQSAFYISLRRVFGSRPHQIYQRNHNIQSVPCRRQFCCGLTESFCTALGLRCWQSYLLTLPTIRKRTENATHEAGVEMTMGVADVPSMEASSMLTSSSVMLLSKASAAAAAAAAAVNTGRGHICDLQRKRDLRSTICRHSWSNTVHTCSD